MDIASRLIGHRGSMHHQPENTLRAIKTAIADGAQAIEFDLQLSRDGVPMLFHDESLQRTTGWQGRIIDHSAEELTAISTRGPGFHKSGAQDEHIPTLDQAIELLNRSPQVQVFIEVKRHSLERFGVEYFVDCIVQRMQSARFKWVIISFIQDVVEYARMHHALRIGWVLREHNATSRCIAGVMQPQFLFTNIKHLKNPEQELWPGPWQWVVYDIEEAEQAIALHKAGADYIETGCIENLIPALETIHA